MEIVVSTEADILRKKYIDTFINIESEFYINGIEQQFEFSDGLCYIGYLWDCYKEKTIVSEKECENFLLKQKNIYIMWDIHSCERIFTPNYWKYGKQNLIFFEKWKGINNVTDLPEDIYVFDKSFKWSIAFTHETNLDNSRYCLWTSV